MTAAQGPQSSLSQFIGACPERDLSLLVINRRSPKPFVAMLEEAFDEQSVTVAERQLPTDVENLVLLVQDGRVVRTSTVEALRDAFLLVNSDRYRTGPHGVQQGDIPAVLTGLNDVSFRLRGYPASNKEKLLLILISRYIESQALTAAAGRLDVAFQRLSRIHDEHGTADIYQQLSDTRVDTHVYGIEDVPAPDCLDVSVHAGESDEYRRSWFLVYRPGPAQGSPAALVAMEDGPNEWEAMWTYSEPVVDEVGAYVERAL